MAALVASGSDPAGTRSQQLVAIREKDHLDKQQRQMISGGKENAEAIAACMGSGDQVITTTPLYPMLSYYGEVMPVSFDLAFFIAEMQGRDEVRERAIGALLETIEEALNGGRRILITEESPRGALSTGSLPPGANELLVCSNPYSGQPSP